MKDLHYNLVQNFVPLLIVSKVKLKEKCKQPKVFKFMKKWPSLTPASAFARFENLCIKYPSPFLSECAKCLKILSSVQ